MLTKVLSNTNKRRSLYLCWSLIVLLIALVGWGNYRFFTERFTNQLVLKESDLLSLSSRQFSRELGHIKSITLFLRSMVPARQAGQTLAQWQDDIASVFTQFANASVLISQVRWFDANGKEWVRINVKDGHAERVPDNQLQNKADRYYIQQGKKLTGNSVYISPLDLNIEKGKVVVPLEPTIRGVTTVPASRSSTSNHILSSNNTKGQSNMVVVNYNLSRLFDQLRLLSDENVFLDIVNPNGDWVLSQDKSNEWAQLLKATKSHSEAGHTVAEHTREQGNAFSSQFPDIWQRIKHGNSLQKTLENDQLWASSLVYIDDALSFQQEQTSNAYLYFLARSNESLIAQEKARVLAIICVIGVIVFVFLAWLVWWQLDVIYKRIALHTALEHEKSQLKASNEALNEANHHLISLQDDLVEARKLSSLGMMVAGLAHEMNTPIGGARMSMSSSRALIKRESNHIEEKNYTRILQSLDLAEGNLSRAADLVSRFKRITSERTDQEIQSFQLQDVIGDMALTFRARFKEHPNIKVLIECHAAISMQGYPGVLSQILQNLINNVLDHAFTTEQKGVLKVIAQQDEDEVVINVSDTGVGIPADLKAHIFEPFVTTGRGKNHTGLGLHLVHQWVSVLMKGHILIESQEGVGSQFMLRIPSRIE